MYLSEIYCRGYSGEDPPLPIPNREVKLTIADGTDPPVGRVGSRGSSKPRASRDARGFFCILSRHSLHCHFERSREIFSVIPRPCPAPAAIEPSFHGSVRRICPPVSGQWPSKALPSAEDRRGDAKRPPEIGLLTATVLQLAARDRAPCGALLLRDC